MCNFEALVHSYATYIHTMTFQVILQYLQWHQTEQLILHEETNGVYRVMAEKLSKGQKEFFYHVLHVIKTSGSAFYCFLSAGGGAGKSRLTKSLY